MTPHCSSDACAQGRRPCPTPQACGSVMPLTVPLAQRQPTFRPDFGIEGPHPEPIAVPWWVLPLVIFLILIVAGAVARWLGVS